MFFISKKLYLSGKNSARFAATKVYARDVGKYYMRKYTIIISVILFGLFSCKNEKLHKPIETLKTKKIAPKVLEENSNPEFSKNDFNLVYQYSNGDSNQILGINILDKKSLKFHIVTETLPCNTEYWGIAENKNWNSDGEIDEDENGGYFVDEYFSDKAEYLVAIRLAADSSKVIIKFLQKDGLETDCLPITHKIMKRIK
jgi:hypothetical protein